MKPSNFSSFYVYIPPSTQHSTDQNVAALSSTTTTTSPNHHTDDSHDNSTLSVINNTTASDDDSVLIRIDETNGDVVPDDTTSSTTTTGSIPKTNRLECDGVFVDMGGWWNEEGDHIKAPDLSFPQQVYHQIQTVRLESSSASNPDAGPSSSTLPCWLLQNPTIVASAVDEEETNTGSRHNSSNGGCYSIITYQPHPPASLSGSGHRPNHMTEFIHQHTIQDLFDQVHTTHFNSTTESILIQCSIIEMIQFDSVNTTKNTNTHIRLRDLLHEPNSDQLRMIPNPNHHDNDTPTSTSSSSTFEIIHATKLSCMNATDIQQLRQMVQLKRFQPPPLEHPTTKISVTMMIQIHIEQVVAVPNRKRTRTGRSLLQLMDVHEYHSNHHNNNNDHHHHHHHHPSQNRPHPILPLALLSGANHAANQETDPPPYYHCILMILPESTSATTDGNDEDHRNNNNMTHHSTITLRTQPILLQTARAIQSFSLTHLQQINSGIRDDEGKKLNEFILNSNNTITELQDEVLRLRRLNTKLQRQCDAYVGPPPKDPNDGKVIERLRTDLLLLQREFQASQREYRTQNTNYIQLQANYATLQQQYSQLQYQYNILQYQHHQSIIFTRQLRKFYYRILHKVLCTGTATAMTSSSTSGSTTTNRCNDHFHTLIENCSFGAPDLRRLCDIDQYMLDCGLLNHTNEVGQDIKTIETTTSDETRMKQCQQEVEHIQAIIDAEPQEPTPNNAILLELQPPKSSSIVTFVSDESIEQIEVRQKYFQTPGGKCITKQEEVMEVELHKSYEMTFQLHQALVKEQLHVDTLMGTITNDKIEKVFDMMRYQQEIQRYQKIIKDKDYDMKAIIYKMNEIHMISQMYQKQIQEQKTYIQQVEQQYQNTQQLYETSTKQYSSQVQQLHQSYNTVQEQLNVLTRPVWQYRPSQHTLTSDSATPPMSIPIPCRFILPFRPGNTDNKVDIDTDDNYDKERYQNEIVLNLQEWMDRVMLSSTATSIPSDDNENDARLQCHISTQTDDMITGGMYEVAHERLFSEKHSTSISEFLFMDSPISMAPDTNPISTALPMQPPFLHDTSIHDGPLAISETSAPITSTTNAPSEISSRNSDVSMSDRYTMTSNVNPAKVGPMAVKFESSPIKTSVAVSITIVETSPQQEPQQELSPVQLMPTKNVDGGGEVAISNVSPVPKMFGAGNRCTRPIWSPKPESDNVKSTVKGIPTDGGFKVRYASPTRRDADELQMSLPEGLNVDPIVHLERLRDSTDTINESRDVNVTLEPTAQVNTSANGDDEISGLDVINQQLVDATTSRPASLQLQSINESSLVDAPAIPENETLLDSQNQTDDSNISDRTKASTIALIEESNTEDLNESSTTRRAFPKSVSEMSASQNVRRSPGPKKLSNFLDRLQKQTQRKLDSDDKSTTPEFLKAFNKIGSKNKNETVVETSGSAPARDGTRTSFEQLRLQGMNPMSRHKSEAASQPTTKKWTPRKSKNDDDSDSGDSFAKAFMSGAQIAKPTPPPQSSSSSQRNHTTVVDDDTSDSDDSFARSFMKNAQVPKSSIPPVNIPRIHTEKSEESDSDESQDERKKVPDDEIPCLPDVASNVVTPCEINTTTSAVASNVKPQFISKKDNDDDSDSDSDSSDDSSKVVTKRPTSNVAASASQHIPMKPMPATSAISQHDETATKTIASPSYRKDDSDSESDDSSKVIAKKTTPVSATLAKIPTKSFKNSSDSDDSDDDSSLESKKRSVKPPLDPAPTTVAPPITKKVDSDGSDDDSSVEANMTQPVKPIAATTKPPKDDSDDSDDSSTDGKKSPTKPNATADIPFTNNQTATKQAVATRDRNSDTDDSSDDGSNMKLKAPEPKEVILSSTCTSLPPRRKVMDSDSDDSDHSNDSTKFGRNQPPPTKATTTVARKNSSDDESSSSSSSSSLPLRNSKVPLPQTTKGKTTKSKDDESSSSSSSHSSESLKRSSTSGSSKQPIEVIDVTNLPDSKSKVPNYTSQIKTGQSESSSSSSLSPIATTTRTKNIAIATTSTTTSTTTGSTTSAAAPCVKKVKYVVQNGKLVKCDDDDDPSERDNHSSPKLQAKESKKSKSSKLEQSQGSLTKSSSRHSTKSPKTKAVPKTTAAPKFVIVDGKLVKQSPAAAAATETSKTKKKKK